MGNSSDSKQGAGNPTPWDIHGKHMGNMGKNMGKHGKKHGKTWENMGKTWEKNIGKTWEKPGKPRKT